MPDTTTPTLVHRLRWTPTDLTLPDDEILVLVATTAGEVGTGFMDGDCWRWADAWRIREDVTHWADMPPHPEDDDQ